VGIYAFTLATSWEDLIFYKKKADDFVRIGSVCVCSRRYLENGLAELEDDPREKDFAEEIKQFLQSNALTYRYWYSEPEDKDFHEVAFEAERNEKGIKPGRYDQGSEVNARWFAEWDEVVARLHAFHLTGDICQTATCLQYGFGTRLPSEKNSENLSHG
jgi:hypothetical protein